MSSSKAIEIKNLTKTYKNKRGIRDINLDIETGDIFALLGPNGAGKTTAMKVITGMMHPDSGDVRIFGHSILTDYELAMASVGCIIETAVSYPYLTAVENLSLTARSYGITDKAMLRSRIDEVLQLTGLGKYKFEKSANYSLGMKQRLGLAAAILPRPRLLILDEPLNGLDVEGMVEVRNLIKRLAATEQTTFFISSHLIHDVELTCDRIGVIFDGQLLRVDSKDNILRDHASLESYFMSEVDRYGKL
ncbi:MAG TPA: ABC transporter [Clostridiales bacterium]|nr:ABC transporter [Clostridiales bacterium]